MSARSRPEARLGALRVGGTHPVLVMGALNVSPESFYGGSVYRDDAALLRAATAMIEAGAALLDVGARSTAPYVDTSVGEGDEARRLAHAVALLAAKVDVPISADTARLGPARAAIDAGASILNDVTTLRSPELAALAAARKVSVVAMAAPAPGGRAGDTPRPTSPASRAQTAAAPVIREILAGALARARAAGIPEGDLVLDPGIGFFRDEPIAWDAWDADVLANLDTLAELGRPVCVGVSRKSFLGAVTGRRDPAERLPASLSATAVAVWHGAAVIRAHDVADTVDAVRVAERLRAARRPAGAPA